MADASGGARASLPGERRSGRLGIVIPSNNLVLEPETYARIGEGVTSHFARIPARSMAPGDYDRMIAHLDDSVGQLAEAGVDTIAYACLSTSLVQPDGWDEAFVSSVSVSHGLPAITAALAVAEGLLARDQTRVTMLSPYPPHLDALVVDWFARKGVEVRHRGSLEVDDIHLMAAIAPEQLIELAARTSTDGVDAIVILATDVRTMDAVDEIERITGLPVHTTNGLVIEAALARLGGGEGRA